eukprot:EG_transcript_26895
MELASTCQRERILRTPPNNPACHVQEVDPWHTGDKKELAEFNAFWRQEQKEERGRCYQEKKDMLIHDLESQALEVCTLKWKDIQMQRAAEGRRQEDAVQEELQAQRRQRKQAAASREKEVLAMLVADLDNSIRASLAKQQARAQTISNDEESLQVSGCGSSSHLMSPSSFPSSPTSVPALPRAVPAPRRGLGQPTQLYSFAPRFPPLHRFPPLAPAAGAVVEVG